MTFENFKILHSETIGYFQLIENDLKLIYSLMHTGNFYDNYNSLNNSNLGIILKLLKELDNSDGKPLISNSDYHFLNQMREKRNYWCHQAYIDFVYNDNFENSVKYKKVCDKLQKDHDQINLVYQNVHKLKLKANRIYSRK